MRYRNRDPIEGRQSEELIRKIVASTDEIIRNFSRKCGYRQGCILDRELHQDVYNGLVKQHRIKSLRINFEDDAGDSGELNEFDTRDKKRDGYGNEESA